MTIAGGSERNHAHGVVEVVIEVPRGSFVKRGSSGAIDFVSPLPCPFNYGSVPALLGRDSDLLDALVPGSRLAAGTRMQLPVRAAVRFIDAGQVDDKLVCSALPLSPGQERAIIAFFHVYAACKRLLNRMRGRRGATRCAGWCDPGQVLARAMGQDHGARGDQAEVASG